MLDRELKVCPALSDEQFLLVIQQLSNSLVRGSVGSLFLDRGENFVQTRAYQHGDSTSSIDWKASARSKDLIVKEHESLRQTVVSLVVDRSGSMTAGFAESSKYTAACILCGGLAYAALKIGSPAGFILSDQMVHPSATQSSARLSAAILMMRRYRLGERTPLSRCLEDGFLRNEGRRLIFVLSDFHDPCAIGALALLAQSHEVILVRLRDRIEEKTPFWATIHIKPSEGGRGRYVRNQSPRSGAVDESLAELGLPVVSIDPQSPISSQLAHFLMLRERIYR